MRNNDITFTSKINTWIRMAIPLHEGMYFLNIFKVEQNLGKPFNGSYIIETPF